MAKNGMLQPAHEHQLSQWIGAGTKTFTLLYSISKDGCSAQTFHQKCDNQGATVTVLYNQQGSIYGGYASKSWNQSGQWVDDPSAFLFQIAYNSKQTFNRFACKEHAYAYYGGQTYGPTFGQGHDLNSFNNTVKASGGNFSLNGSMSVGMSYDNKGVQANQINNGSMVVTDLEVYKVTDPELYSDPWRKTPAWDEQLLSKLIEDIVNFKPIPELKIPQAKVLLVGPVGAGKSSFYNTINSAFRGRITQRASCGSAETSLTTTYTQYQVRVQSGATLNVRLCDTRGLEESQGLDVIELNYLLDGNIPDFYQFNPSCPITPETSGFISRPTAADKIHCVLFVIDATTLDVVPANVVQKIKNFQKVMTQKGVAQAVLLTKVDKLCAFTAKDVSSVFRSILVERHVDKASEMFGVPRGNVLPAKNYENELELDDKTSILALLALRQVLYFSEDYMENLLDRLRVEERGVQRLNVKD